MVTSTRTVSSTFAVQKLEASASLSDEAHQVLQQDTPADTVSESPGTSQSRMITFGRQSRTSYESDATEVMGQPLSKDAVQNQNEMCGGLVT